MVRRHVFGWQVKGAPQMQIGIDPNKSHSGARSLRLTFHVRTNLENDQRLATVRGAAATLNTSLNAM